MSAEQRIPVGVTHRPQGNGAVDEDPLYTHILSLCQNGSVRGDPGAYRAGVHDAARLAAAAVPMMVRSRIEEQTRVRDHESRTPIAILRSAVDTLLTHRKRLDDADHEKVLKAMSRQIDALTALSAHLETSDEAVGEFDVHMVPTDISRLVREATADLQIGTPDHEFVVQIEHRGILAEVDPDAIRRIMAILIGNAAAYSPAGGTITVHLAARRGRAVLAVSDDGPGIPAAKREGVFAKGQRLSCNDSDNGGGHGLGLYLARGLARAQGFDLTLVLPGHSTGATLELTILSAVVAASDS